MFAQAREGAVGSSAFVFRIVLVYCVIYILPLLFIFDFICLSSFYSLRFKVKSFCYFINDFASFKTHKKRF